LWHAKDERNNQRNNAEIEDVTLRNNRGETILNSVMLDVMRNT